MPLDCVGFGYDFETTSLITELSLKVLKSDGKLLARVSTTYGFFIFTILLEMFACYLSSLYSIV